MRPSNHRLQSARSAPGFTLIEVMFATMLLGVVGMAIVGFMGAYARGIDSRTTLNDPALDSTLAARRLAALAPGFCYVLQVKDASAAIWLSDTVPSCTVHLSELAVVRFDDAEGTLVFETVDPAHFANFAGADMELTPNATIDFVEEMAKRARQGDTLRQILAEGLDATAFSTTGVSPGSARVTLTMPSGAATLALSPSFLEEPRQ